jgi:small subunit ribosomal protein S6e
LSKGHSCYRPRGPGERKHKSVHRCIVDASLRVLKLAIVKATTTANNQTENKREEGIPRLKDTPVSWGLGPRGDNRIRKHFNLSKRRWYLPVGFQKALQQRR